MTLAAPALLGRASLAPDTFLDNDRLYATVGSPPVPRVGDFTPIVVDLPRDLAVARGLAQGRLDLWNPLAGCGAPLWAEQGGPFFPLKAPFYLAPSRRTYDLFLTLRLVLAALGAYLLARRRGLAPIAAIAAGAIFEMSGAMVAQLSFGNSSATCVLPWALLGSEVIARDRTPKAAAGAAVALGLAGNGGHPTLILLVFIAFAAAIGGHAAAAWRSPRIMLAITAWGGVAVLIGLALAAPALLPLGELAGLSSTYKDRHIGKVVWDTALWRYRGTLPIALFAPHVLALIGDRIESVHAFAPVLGVLGILLAGTGLASGAIDAALASVALLGVVLATMPPGLTWVHDLPALRLVMPTYAWPLVALPLAQAAGAGLVALGSPGGRRAASIGVIVVWAGLLSLWPAADLNSYFNYATVLRAALARREGIIRLVVPPMLALLVASAGRLMRHGRSSRRYAVGVAVLAVLEELLVLAPRAHQQPSAALVGPPSPAVRWLQASLAAHDARFAGVPYTVGYPMTPMLFGLPDVRGVAALPIRRLQLYRDAMAPGAWDFTIQDAPFARSPLLDLAAVRYVVVPSPPSPKLRLNDDAEAIPVYGDSRVSIYQNRAALPRVRIAHKAATVTDAQAAQTWLKQFAGSAAHAAALGLDDSVVLEPDAEGRSPPTSSGARSPQEEVRIQDQPDPDRLVLSARLESPGFVVIADTYYPGWDARVDGSSASLFPADLLFRAVFVPAGEHTLVLRYRPPSFRYGIAVFVFGCLACIGLLWAKSSRKDDPVVR